MSTHHVFQSIWRKGNPTWVCKTHEAQANYTHIAHIHTYTRNLQGNYVPIWFACEWLNESFARSRDRERQEEAKKGVTIKHQRRSVDFFRSLNTRWHWLDKTRFATCIQRHISIRKVSERESTNVIDNGVCDAFDPNINWCKINHRQHPFRMHFEQLSCH